MRMVGRITYSYACSVTRMNSTYSVSSTSSSFHRCHGQKQSNIKMIHVFKLYFSSSSSTISLFLSYIHMRDVCTEARKLNHKDETTLLHSTIGAFTYENILEFSNGTPASARHITEMRSEGKMTKVLPTRDKIKRYRKTLRMTMSSTRGGFLVSPILIYNSGQDMMIPSDFYPS